MPDVTPTEPIPRARPAILEVRALHLSGVEGAFSGRSFTARRDHVSIGSHPSNDLVVDDPAVSRFHCELRLEGGQVRLRDLGSRNGTLVDGMIVNDVFVRAGALLTLGRTILRLQVGTEVVPVRLSERTAFGALAGRSPAMRAVFALLERAALVDSTVLLEGETGTGKGAAAEALHHESPRARAPFATVDCGAIPPPLLESELFGHARGAFTGATTTHAGVFEAAAGGTLFLDEIGELPLELQPKLLRVLENRQIRRLGSAQSRRVDVRVVAATNRDLRAEVNAGRFRSDLYFRLAVVRIALPPLREHLEDLPVLVGQILDAAQVTGPTRETLLSPAFLASLGRSSWPGNVRELRNQIERCLVFQRAIEPSEPDPPPRASRPVDPSVPYEEARRRALDEFEQTYMDALLSEHSGDVTAAAQAAQIHRGYAYKLVKRHGLGR